MPKKTSWGKIAKLCMLQTVAQYLFFYIGLANTSGVKASIIEGVNVFISILVASLIFHQERLTTRKMAGCLIGFKRYSQEENPVTLSGYQFVMGGLIMVICGLLMGGRLEVITPAGIAMLLYLAVISAVAYSLWGILLKYNPVSRVTVFGFMNPVFGVILSAIFLKESDNVGIICVVALALVCAGIYIVNKKQNTGEA